MVRQEEAEMPPPLRSFSRDASITSHKLAPGTMRRIAQFARPYRAWLVAFLVLIVFDALVGAAGPLVYKAIIDQGIMKQREGFVIAMAALVSSWNQCLF